jgi:hypothetical protein
LFIPATNFIEMATNAGSEVRRYYDESHFEKYLLVMKDNAEKVSFIYHLSPTHFHPEIGSMVGDMVPILLKKFANILG